MSNVSLLVGKSKVYFPSPLLLLPLAYISYMEKRNVDQLGALIPLRLLISIFFSSFVSFSLFVKYYYQVILI